MKKTFYFSLALLCALAVWVTGCVKSEEGHGQRVTETIRGFIQTLNENNTANVRSFLAEESLELSMPSTRLGEAIRENLKVIKVANIQGSDFISADVTLETLDLKQIMSRAAYLWLAESQAVDDRLEPDQTDEALAKIYDTILNENEYPNLPKKTMLAIFTLVNEKGNFKILLDEALRNDLNGNMLEAIETIRLILTDERE